MQELNVINNINYVEYWIIRHQQILLKCTINIVSAIFITIFGTFFSKILSNTFNTILLKRKIDNTISDFLTIIIKYILIIITIMISLGQIGVQTTSVIAILGAAGMAIGLALQGSLSNFASGVLLVVFSPLRIGEYVVLKKVAGTVLKIHVFYTTLKTLDGKIIVVPNNKITSNNIINYSRAECRRNEFSIYISYEYNVHVIIKIIKDTIYNEPRVLKNKDITVGINKFEPYFIKFIARCWSNTNILNAVYWDLMIQFKKSLDKNNIKMSYPPLEEYINKNYHIPILK